MDNKELYLYGTLMALAQEQQEAISQLTSGTLGFFGKSRIQSRGREIGKLAAKIVKYKNQLGKQNANESILADLESIKNGNFPKKYSENIVDMVKNYF